MGKAARKADILKASNVFITYGLLIFWVLFCAFPVGSTAPEGRVSLSGDFLVTPLIKSGHLEEARKASSNDWSVLGTPSDSKVTSYSGFFTLDDGSHLFYWFFPSQQNPESAPIILWVNELPGWSLISGVLTQTGPFQIEANGQLSPRNSSWTKTHSLVYIDCPTGTGFSFSDNEDVSANDVEGDEVYKAFQQFLVLFPEFQKQDLYLAGENYAASFIPYILRHIEAGNAQDGSIKVNLKGLVIGSPFLDIRQFNRAQSLYNLGLLDKHGKMEMEGIMHQAEELVKSGKVTEGSQLALSTYYGPDSIMSRYTGFENTRSVLKTKTDPELLLYKEFLARPEVLNFLHVSPSRKFIGENPTIFSHFAKEILGSRSQIFEEILNENYRVLFYSPQFDLLNTLERTVESVNSLRWSGSEAFQKAPRTIWKTKDDIAGYVKVSGNFTFVILRSAGNLAISDQPEWASEMVETFLYNKAF